MKNLFCDWGRETNRVQISVKTACEPVATSGSPSSSALSNLPLRTQRLRTLSCLTTTVLVGHHVYWNSDIFPAPNLLINTKGQIRFTTCLLPEMLSFCSSLRNFKCSSFQQKNSVFWLHFITLIDLLLWGGSNISWYPTRWTGST